MNTFTLEDSRSVAAIDVAERYANGLATEEELRSDVQAAAFAARTVVLYSASDSTQLEALIKLIRESK